MYIDFKIGDGKLEQFSFMEMSKLDYTIFKEMFFKYIDNFTIQYPQHTAIAKHLTSVIQNAENEIKYYESLIANNEI